MRRTRVNLRRDSIANPSNTTLATAVANLSKGNDAKGADKVAISGALGVALGMMATGNSDATITINSSANFALSGTVLSAQYDLDGGLEHELDEVLGGGGAGSILNYDYGGCSKGSTCYPYVGALDLYRYSAPGKPSSTTSSSASSYFSVNGGTTKVVAFNQNYTGDFGDFGSSAKNAAGQYYIQDAFIGRGPDEPYTASSPEYEMMEALGDHPASVFNAGAIAPVTFNPFPSALQGSVALGMPGALDLGADGAGLRRPGLRRTALLAKERGPRGVTLDGLRPFERTVSVGRPSVFWASSVKPPSASPFPPGTAEFPPPTLRRRSGAGACAPDKPSRLDKLRGRFPASPEFSSARSPDRRPRR